MRVLVLTTSYPRGPDDVAGVFVRDAVEHLREAGVEVRRRLARLVPTLRPRLRERDRRQPAARAVEGAALPLFLASYVLAARRAARGRDLVHAHWLPSALPALATRKPFVVQLWGTDVELARRAPGLSRRMLLPARGSSCAPRRRSRRRLASSGLARRRVVPSGVEIPEPIGEPAEPPHVLFAGRLSEEKGILEFLEATEGLPRVVVGDGPLRDRVPEARASSPPGELGAYYERAAVVACPSRREGYGVAAREAMAHGRPVVASAVGGLLDAVEDGVTGLLVAATGPRRAASGDRASARRPGVERARSGRPHASGRVRSFPGTSRPPRPLLPIGRHSPRSRRAPEYHRPVPELIVSGRRIADDAPAYVIAEIGHNHQGELEKAKALIHAARECGVDAVKFQKRENRASSRASSTSRRTTTRTASARPTASTARRSSWTRPSGSSSAATRARRVSRSSRPRSTSRAPTSSPGSASTRSSSPPETSSTSPSSATSQPSGSRCSCPPAAARSRTSTAPSRRSRRATPSCASSTARPRIRPRSRTSTSR